MGVNGIYGLSGSGLDVESMVKVGMLSKQSEYDKMQKKYTKNEWKKAEYLSLYGEIQTFNNSTLSQYKMSSSMNARSASSANTAVVTATANATAATMTHYVEVNQLAAAAYLIGTDMPEMLNTSKTTSTQLTDYLFSSLSENNEGKIVIGDETTTYTAADVAFEFSLNDGVNGMLKSSNDKAVTAYATPGAADSGSQTVVISALATSASSTGVLLSNVTSDSAVYNLINNSAIQTYITNNSTSTSNALTFNFGDGKKTADISFSIADFNDSLDDFIDNLNEKFSEAGLTLEAIFTTDDNGKGGILLQNTEAGSANTITIAASSIDSGLSGAASAGQSGFLAKSLFLGNSADVSNASNNFSYTVNNGTDVQGTIDGTDISSLTNATVSRNTVTYNGITYTAKTTTDSNGVTLTNPGALIVAVTYGELLEGYTFNDLTSKINTLGTNVRSSYDTVQNKFYFYNKESGSENNMTFSFGTDDAGTKAAKFMSALGLKQSAAGEIVGDALSFEAGGYQTLAGQDAQVKIDGVTYDISSNKTTVSGVVYNFQNVTSDGNKIAVSVTQDTESIVNKVQSFVDDYNALLTKLYKWYEEKPNDKYEPLSETEKSALKEEQIEKWEEKAKAGLLYHDKTLGELITKLRSAVSDKVEGIDGKYNTIFSLGISTTGLKGQLTLDKDKLNAALAEDPDAVYNVFAKLDSDDRRDYNGVAQRLGDVFMEGMKSISSVSGSSADVAEDSELNNLLRELQTKMSNFKKMMSAFETKLYKKYDAMESALALLGTQLNYVTSAFQ